jgi:hypothetical protein
MTLKQYRQVEDAGKGEAMATTHVGQVAKIEQQEGRTTADARTSSRAPGSKPTGKAIPVNSAEMLQVGMHIRLTDQQVHGIAVVKFVYPRNHKSLDVTEASAYLEGINSHSWSGLYFDEHLKQYQAAIVQES